MMELTGIKEQNGIYTYSYKVDPPKNAGKAGSGQQEQSFAECFNNAANIEQKTSKSDYTQAEWDAQRAKNNAIGKLQKVDPDVAALERVAPNASEEVKSAWIDAAKETGYNGMGYGGSGATRLFADLAESARMTDNSIAGVQDLLGGTVESAIDAISSASYDRAHIDSDSADPENLRKEQEFYDSFLEKLNGLKDRSYIPSDESTFERLNKGNLEVLPGDGVEGAEALEVSDNYGQGYFFHKTTAMDADGNRFELSARYPGDYDKTDPSVEVYVLYKGQESLYKVDVGSGDPDSASQTELYGLFAYIEDDKNVPRNIDPDSSDIYYSGLDKKYEKIRSEGVTETDTEEMLTGFKSMDTLSYWEKKDLRKSLYEIM